MIKSEIINKIKEIAIDKEYEDCNIKSTNAEFINKNIIKTYLNKLNCIDFIDKYEYCINNNIELKNIFDNKDYDKCFNKYSPLITVEKPYHVSSISIALGEYIYNHEFKFEINNNCYNLANIDLFEKQIIDNEAITNINKLNDTYNDLQQDDATNDNEEDLEYCAYDETPFEKYYNIIKDITANGYFDQRLFGHLFEAIVYLQLLKILDKYEECKNNYLNEVFERVFCNEILKYSNISYSIDNYNIITIIQDSLKHYKDYIDIILTKIYKNKHIDNKIKDIIFVICYSLAQVIEEVSTKDKNTSNEEMSAINNNILYMLNTLNGYANNIKLLKNADVYYTNCNEKYNTIDSIYNYSLYIFEYLKSSIKQMEYMTNSKFISIDKKLNLTSNFIHAEADYILYFKDNETNNIYYFVTDCKRYETIMKKNLLNFLLQVIGYKHQINILNNRPSFRKLYGFDKKIFKGYIIISPFEKDEKYNFYYNIHPNESYEEVYEDYITTLMNEE